MYAGLEVYVPVGPVYACDAEGLGHYSTSVSAISLCIESMAACSGGRASPAVRGSSLSDVIFMFSSSSPSSGTCIVISSMSIYTSSSASVAFACGPPFSRSTSSRTVWFVPSSMSTSGLKKKSDSLSSSLCLMTVLKLESSRLTSMSLIVVLELLSSDTAANWSLLLSMLSGCSSRSAPDMSSCSLNVVWLRFSAPLLRVTCRPVTSWNRSSFSDPMTLLRLSGKPDSSFVSMSSRFTTSGT